MRHRLVATGDLLVAVGATVGLCSGSGRGAPIDRWNQGQMCPRIEDNVGADNPVRAIDAYVETLNLATLGFVNADGDLTPGQPAFDPAALLKLDIYGYVNRVQSSRRLARECRRNLTRVLNILGPHAFRDCCARRLRDHRAATEVAIAA